MIYALTSHTFKMHSNGWLKSFSTSILTAIMFIAAVRTIVTAVALIALVCAGSIITCKLQMIIIKEYEKKLSMQRLVISNDFC